MIAEENLPRTIGIVSGAVWANEAWGNYWSWDPKERTPWSDTAMTLENKVACCRRLGRWSPGWSTQDTCTPGCTSLKKWNATCLKHSIWFQLDFATFFHLRTSSLPLTLEQAATWLGHQGERQDRRLWLPGGGPGGPDGPGGGFAGEGLEVSQVIQPCRGGLGVLHWCSSPSAPRSESHAFFFVCLYL